VSFGQLTDLESVGYPRERLMVIHNGVEPVAATAPRDDVREALGLGYAFVALLVATLRPQKRAPHFVEAVLQAHELDQRIRGIIVGGGPDYEAVRALAGGTRGIVRMLGERNDVADLMVAADVVCLTSWTEGLPMVLLEAMSLGKAIVGTDVPGVRDAVVEGETGVLVPATDPRAFGEALARCARDSESVEAMGRAGRERFDHAFTADRMVEQYAALLRAVVDRSPTGERS
jgi:glycosyltransferase involved in cell wall biosynthesis